MSTINATIVGRLARDPETRTTPKGTTVTTMTIPVDTGSGDNKVTTWWRVTMFGRRAEVVGKYLKKNKWATFSGEVSVREYTKKDGSKGWSAEMKADTFGFVGNKSDNDGSGQSGGYSGGNRGPSGQSGGGAGFADQDIPF